MTPTPPPNASSPSPTRPGEPALSTDGPILAGVRGVVRAVRELAASQHQQSAALLARRDRSLADADASKAQALADADQRLRSELDAAERDRDEALRTLSDRVASERAAADLAQRAESSDLNDRVQNDLNRAAKARDDSLWLAESVYDTRKDKPGAEFESLRRELDDRLKAASAAVIAANEFLGHCKCPRIPEPPADLPPAEGDGAATRAREAAASVVEGAAAIRRLLAPRLMQEIVPVVLLLLFGAAGVGVVALALHERTGAMLAAGGGGGVALGLIVVLVAWTKARSATRIRGARLAQDLGTLHLQCAAAIAHAQTQREHAERALRAARDTEYRRAKETYADIEQRVRALATGQAAALKARQQDRAAALTDLDRTGRDNAARAFEFRTRAAQDEHARATREALNRHHAARSDAAESFAREWDAMAARWHRGMREQLERANQLAGAVADQPAELPPPEALSLPTTAHAAVRLGRVDLDLHAIPGAIPQHPDLLTDAPASLPLPVALEPPARGSLLIEIPPSPPEAREHALAVINSAALRLLATHPPGKVRFTLIDPVGLGQSFAGLMHLADYFPGLVNERIWSESRHVEQRLADLTEHMETVIQKFLRNQFPDIAAYNAQAGEVAEPYRFLVLADFPAGFSEQAMARLAAIISAGPRCGVYTLIAANLREKLPTGGPSMRDLERAALTLVHKQGRWQLADPDLGGLALHPDPRPADDRFNALVHAIGRQSQDAGRVQVPFEVVAPPPAQLWTGDSSSEVRAPLGRAGALKVQHMALGKGTAQHALIAGRTGSGKSTLLHVIITSVAMWYSPDEVELYLIDFKKGVEFKPYAQHRLPHARVIAIESEREFGLSVLRRLDEELQRRGELFRRHSVQDVAGFRRSVASAPPPHTPLPRILLLIDEFQELFAEDDRLAAEAALLLDRLVRQGRAFGMHVVLGSQTLAGSYSLPRSTIGQMAVRVALQCSEADSYLILSDDNPAARLLSRPGEAIYNDASGMLEGNSPFQVAWLDDDRRSDLIARLRTLADARSRRDTPPIVFEGSRPAELPASGAIAELLANAPAHAPGVPRALLGDPIAIKEPTAALLPRQSSSNLLIIGQREDAALGMTAGALASLSAQLARTPGARVLIADGTPADAPAAGLLTRLAEALGPVASSVAYRQLTAAVAQLAEEVRRREADPAAHPTQILVVHGLQRFRQLRKQEDDWGGSLTSTPDDAAPTARPDKDLAEILEKGPPLGVHVIAWCDTLSNLERTLARGALREFDTRVLQQVSASDSSALIDSPSASNLGPYRAVLYSESSGVVERFRPFAPPPAQWPDEVARQRSW